MIFFNRIYRLTVYRVDGKPLDKPIVGFLPPVSFNEILANGIEITGHDIEFEIDKSIGKRPNKCEIKIYNLTEETGSLLSSSSVPLTVKLDAGYDDVPRLLFHGNLRFASNQRGRTDWVTELILSDGGRAYDHATASKTYAPGTPVRNIVRDAAASMGLRLPRQLEEDPSLSAQIARGTVLDGYSRESLSRLLAPYGYTWSVQNGQMQALKDTQVRSESEFVINAADAGLIGQPSYGYHAGTKKKGPKVLLTFSCMLYPELQPGSRVRIESEAAQGAHRIIKVKHRGNTRGDEWSTTCEAQPL